MSDYLDLKRQFIKTCLTPFQERVATKIKNRYNKFNKMYKTIYI